MVVSFNQAKKANLNDGITSSLILFSVVFILIIQYLLYKDRINFLQGVGLAIILLGVFVISFFKAASESDVTDYIAPPAGSSLADLYPWAKFLCIANGK